MVGEEPFASGEQAGHLGHDAGDPVDVEPGGDAADVWQVGEPAERTTTEVEAVELHLPWGMGQRQAEDQGAQQGALPTLRCPDHTDVAGAPGEVDHEQVAQAVERPVDDADRH